MLKNSRYKTYWVIARFDGLLAQWSTKLKLKFNLASNLNVIYIEIGKQQRLPFEFPSSNFRREIERESPSLLAPLGVCFRESARRKGDDRKSRRRNCFLSGRRAATKILPKAPPCFSTYTKSARVLFPKQSGTIRGARSVKDETRRWRENDGGDNAAGRNCLKSWIPTGS